MGPSLVLGLIVSQVLDVNAPALRSALVVGGGMVLAALASVGLAFFSNLAERKWALSSDSVQAVLLGLGFGLGLLLLSLVQTHFPGQRAGLDRLLLGNAAVLTMGDIWLGLFACLIVILKGTVLRRPLTAFLFDPGAWQARGGRLWLAETLYTILLFSVTIAGMRLVGAVLMVALLTLPYLIVQPWIRRDLDKLVGLGGLAAAFGATLGVLVSALPTGAQGEGLPAGPSIVLTLFGLALMSHGAARMMRARDRD